jgi:hypothetical protein
MPKLSEMLDETPVKLLLVGDPGSGKTGALVSLVKAGYRLFIQEYDSAGHLAPLNMFLSEEEQERVIVAVLRDELSLKGKVFWPRKPPTAFSNGMRLLDGWKEGEIDYGSIYDWGLNDVLVIDTLTSQGRSAMWYKLFLNQRQAAISRGARQLKRPKDYGEAMDYQSDFLDMLNSNAVGCNVVVVAHLKYLSSKEFEDEDEGGKPDDKKTKRPANPYDEKLYPSALGRELPKKVPGMFSAVAECKIVGAGPKARRVIRTVPEANVDVKIPALGLPSELPIEDGLARIFEAVKQGKAGTK